MPLPEKTLHTGSVRTQLPPVARKIPSSHAENHIVRLAEKMKRRTLARAFAVNVSSSDPASFSAAATSISNVGPGLGQVIGPAYSFSQIPEIAKWLLSFGMLAGRLEFLTLIVIFNKSFWR